MYENCHEAEDSCCFKIIRKRFIPDECLVLNKDRICHMAPDLVLTAWETLKPRADIAGGFSAYYPERGFKISHIYDHNHDTVYWYCDIIRAAISGQELYYEDLLLDVVLMPDGQIKILDADELADALEQKLIDEDTCCLALRQMNDLLTYIYSGDFRELQQPILELERGYSEKK